MCQNTFIFSFRRVLNQFLLYVVETFIYGWCITESADFTDTVLRQSTEFKFYVVIKVLGTED